jgi:hypothetical protein
MNSLTSTEALLKPLKTGRRVKGSTGSTYCTCFRLPDIQVSSAMTLYTVYPLSLCSDSSLPHSIQPARQTRRRHRIAPRSTSLCYLKMVKSASGLWSPLRRIAQDGSFFLLRTVSALFTLIRRLLLYHLSHIICFSFPPRCR